jgi:molybdenum cofactor guanylyltransferase
LINPTLIILAGGRSSRMGFDKGFIDYEGKHIIQHLIDENASYFSDVLISSNNKAHKVFNHKVIVDKITHAGPISGIISCLEKSKSDLNIFISCDSPLIQLKILKKILSKSVKADADIIYCKYKGITHPFPGCFNKRILNDLNKLILKGERKMLNLNKYFNVDYVNFSNEKKDFFLNLNFPEDLNKIK